MEMFTGMPWEVSGAEYQPTKLGGVSRSDKRMQNYAQGASGIQLTSCFIDRHRSSQNCNLPSLCAGY